MAIAKMSRMKLVGVISDEKEIIAALHKTCSVQIIKNEDATKKNQDRFAEKFGRLDLACDFLFKNINRIAKENKAVEPLKEEAYGVLYDDFINALNSEPDIENVILDIEKIKEQITSLNVSLAAIKAEMSAYKPFIRLKKKFSFYGDTQRTRVISGQIPKSYVKEFTAKNDYFDGYVEYEESGLCVVSVVYLKENERSANELLSSFGFKRCLFNGDFTAKERFESLASEEKSITKSLLAADQKIASLRDKYKDMKILGERYRFEMEKNADADGFFRTDSVFMLEGFVPSERAEAIDEQIKKVSDRVCTSYTPVPKDEFAPTLMQNRKLTRQFEFVTNLFSPPKYGTIDQNFVMMIFFSVFMGFIMADMGYGLIMMVGGFLYAKKKGRDTGVTRLANIIAFGGIFTVIFGVLFDSFFGYGLLTKMGLLDGPVMPDAINHKLSISGISVPTLLLISLGMGVVQIIASLLLKAAASFSEGKILDGIFDGVSWACFLGALIVFVLDLTGVISGAGKISVIVMIASVGIGALTAGRHEKGFGKVTKAFTSVYGLINYMSDILSYARLYGLMLSGAQIAQIVTNLSLPMFNGAMSIVAVLILIIGHAFNLVMGLLGAYIHDSRLQYIEFYGRFYEGEGELFTPFGTKFESVYFADK